MTDGKKDIWTESIKCIMGANKKSLLDFVDALDKNNLNNNLKDTFGLIKGRIHNDISQATLSLGILLENLKVGGNISTFVKQEIEGNNEEPWAIEIKNIVIDTKSSLINFVNAIFTQKEEKNKNDFDLIISKIENNMDRTVINIGILFSTFKKGGDISAFENNIRRKDSNSLDKSNYHGSNKKNFNPINIKK